MAANIAKLFLPFHTNRQMINVYRSKWASAATLVAAQNR